MAVPLTHPEQYKIDVCLRFEAKRVQLSCHYAGRSFGYKPESLSDTTYMDIGLDAHEAFAIDPAGDAKVSNEYKLRHLRKRGADTNKLQESFVNQIDILRRHTPPDVANVTVVLIEDYLCIAFEILGHIVVVAMVGTGPVEIIRTPVHPHAETSGHNTLDLGDRGLRNDDPEVVSIPTLEVITDEVYSSVPSPISTLLLVEQHAHENSSALLRVNL